MKHLLVYLFHVQICMCNQFGHYNPVNGSTHSIVCKNNKLYMYSVLTHQNGWVVTDFDGKPEDQILQMLQECCIFNRFPKREYLIELGGQSIDCRTLTFETDHVTMNSRPCNNFYYALFEQNATATYDTSPNCTSNGSHVPSTLTSSWKTLGNREYYINRNNLTYPEAEEVCRGNNGASLTWFPTHEHFTGLVHELKLEIGLFWVGGANSDVEIRGEALVLNVKYPGGTKDSTVTPVSQQMSYYSLCSRIANSSEVLVQPYFTKLLDKMTIEAKKTDKARRKLTSMYRSELSSKVLGSGFGIFLLIAMIGSIVLMDIPALVRCVKRCQYNRERCARRKCRDKHGS